MNKILIIEDDRRVANFLRFGLEEMGYLSFVAYDAETGLELFHAGKYDLIVTDVMLPEMNGFEFVKKIKAHNSNIPVIIITALGATNQKLAGFHVGADDYMVKPFDILELEARIRVHLKRSNPDISRHQARELHYAGLKADLMLQKVFRNGQILKLTPKEFNLLVYMMQNPERVLSRAEIAEKIWNTHIDIQTNFINVCISYLRKKVDHDFDTKLIHTKPGVGFILCSGYENQE